MEPQESKAGLVRGQVVKAQSGFYEVHTDEGEYLCRLRGRLKKGQRKGDLVAVGDWVWITLLQDGSGLIESVEPRVRMFSRLAPSPQGEYQQVLIANLDQAILVFACAHPSPRLGMLDRFLVIAEKQGIAVIIVANKIDLVGEHVAREMFAPYQDVGYEVLYTSAVSGQGVAELRARLAKKISLFTGPSGTGKTSLLNAIQPGLGLRVRSVSRATGKGRHATVLRQMFPLKGGGYVADTPGIKALAFWDITPEELDGYFPELRPLVPKCQFSDCTHVNEPNCAVLEALQRGVIHPQRYQSYLRMRFGEVE